MACSLFVYEPLVVQKWKTKLVSHQIQQNAITGPYRGSHHFQAVIYSQNALNIKWNENMSIYNCLIFTNISPNYQCHLNTIRSAPSLSLPVVKTIAPGMAQSYDGAASSKCRTRLEQLIGALPLSILVNFLTGITQTWRDANVVLHVGFLHSAIV